MTSSTPTPDPPNTIYFFNGRIGYTPHIYTKDDWKKHKQIFIALQLIPLILTTAFAYFSEGTDVAIVIGFLSPLFSTWYWVWTIANVGAYVLAKVENDRHQRKLKEELR